MPASTYLPILLKGQWLEVLSGCSGIYSYGDSAGSSPDFPFNDAEASTMIAANVKIIFHLFRQVVQNG